MPKKKEEFPYPLGTPLYEVKAIGLDNKNYFIQSYDTERFYLTFEEAHEAARRVADNFAWSQNIPGQESNDVFVVRIFYGRKFSKKKTVYSFGKVVYGISTGTKEMTDAVTPDPLIKALRIDEYTEQPHLTKYMFHQWK